MNKYTKVFIGIWVVLFLSGCLGSSPEMPSSTSVHSGDIANYTVKRNRFYGFELLEAPANIPAIASVQVDPVTQGKKYVFADAGGVFSVITAYVNEGKLTRLTLGKSHATASEADKFWHLLLDKAEESYPKGTLVNSGIGAYVRFENSPEKWQQKYRAFKNKHSMENFNLAYHQYLKSVAFDLFAGKDRKIFVSVDYITGAYQNKRNAKSRELNQKLESI